MATLMLSEYTVVVFTLSHAVKSVISMNFISHYLIYNKYDNCGHERLKLMLNCSQFKDGILGGIPSTNVVYSMSFHMLQCS